MSRHVLRFRHSDTGLTPSFTYFKKVSDLSNVCRSLRLSRLATEPTTSITHLHTTSLLKSTVAQAFQLKKYGTLSTQSVREIHGLMSPSLKSTQMSGPTARLTQRPKGVRVDQLGDLPMQVRLRLSLESRFSTKKLSVEMGQGFRTAHLFENVYDRLGAPTGASVVVDIAAVATSVKGSAGLDISQIAGTGWAAPLIPSRRFLSHWGAPTLPSIAAAVWDVDLTTHTTAGTSGAKLGAAASQTDINVAQSSIKGASNIDATQLYTRLGAPAGFSCRRHRSNQDRYRGAAANVTALGTQLTRALGLMHENSVLDQTIYDSSNNLISGRLRIYNSKAMLRERLLLGS